MTYSISLLQQSNKLSILNNNTKNKYYLNKGFIIDFRKYRLNFLSEMDVVNKIPD